MQLLKKKFLALGIVTLISRWGKATLHAEVATQRGRPPHTLEGLAAEGVDALLFGEELQHQRDAEVRHGGGRARPLTPALKKRGVPPW